MKTRFGKKLFSGLILLVALGLPNFINGCNSTNHLKKQDYASIRESFNIFAKSMVSGDLTTAYYYLGSYYKQEKCPTFEQFAQDYEDNKQSIILEYQHASVKDIGISADEFHLASVILNCGSGGEFLCEFINENGVWKINRPLRHIPPS